MSYEKIQVISLSCMVHCSTVLMKLVLFHRRQCWSSWSGPSLGTVSCASTVSSLNAICGLGRPFTKYCLVNRAAVIGS